MKIIIKRTELSSAVSSLHAASKRIGFVPTMGALHEGHLSLIRRAKQDNDVVVVSVFVNPTQFNDPQDFQHYPRVADEDARLLEGAGCDIAFFPTTEEIYPEKDERQFDFGYIGSVMEGARRPGHFNGVAQVVSRLFNIVTPENAYFGQKDFQQIAIIREMVRMLNISVNIVSCPIVREADGLALSSRNRLLSSEERASAPFIAATLRESLQWKNSLSVNEVKERVVSTINNHENLRVEYFEIVEEISLKPVNSWSEPGVKVGCITVYCGNIRLIDNIFYL